jgi:hypothetical protein
MLTDREHRAVLEALMWLRQEADLDYELDASHQGQDRAALTRAIKKLGGDPYPKRARLFTAAEIRGRFDARASTAEAVKVLEAERRQEKRRRRVGFDLGGGHD